MPTQTEDAISEALLAELQERAAKQGFRSLLDGDDAVASAVAASGSRPGFRSDTDHECIIFDTSSGEPRIIPTVFLAKTLKKRRGGKKAFVAADPETGRPLTPVPEYRYGELMCFLHPDHPERHELEALGLGPEIICGDNETAPAAHFKTAYDVRMHESKCHPISWGIREEWREKKEREDARLAQDRYTNAILQMAGRQAGGGGPVVYPCTDENCTRFFDSDEGRKIHESKAHAGVPA